MLSRTLLVGLFVVPLQVFGGPPGAPPPALRFEPAVGITTESAEFRARGQGYALRVASSGFQLALSEPSSPTSLAEELPSPGAASTITVRLLGAASNVLGEGRNRLESHSNYLVGRNRENWRTGVPHFSLIHFTDVYPGIDIDYYSSQGRLEFDFLVSSGATPEQIRMRFDGASNLRINDAGDLVITTSGGEISQRKPQVFQTVNGERIPIEGRYVLAGNQEVRFTLNPYDKSLPLLIDPILDWATFIGGSGDDDVRNLTTDQQGNVYVVGRTVSTDFPTEGPQQGALSGPTDLFITKLTPDGSGLGFSTYLGGSGLEVPGGIALDSEGNVYVSGGTTSADFPTTAGSLQPDFRGEVDAFVAKLNPQGSDLVYSTFLGGTGQDLGYDLRVDNSNHAYVTGSVDGAGESFPVSEGAFQSTHGGQFDAFITKIDPAGANLVYSTLFGGNGSEIPVDLELNAQGEAHIAGIASSTDFPGTPGAYQENIVAGTFDAFIAKLNANGTDLEYLSFLGGSGDDEASGLSLDPMGNAWLSGGTGSTDFPTTPDAPNPNYLGGPSDGFFARLPLPQETLLTEEHTTQSKGQAPTFAPLVSYVGSELRNFGLDIIVREPAVNQKGNFFGLLFTYSLSNFAETPTEVNGEMITGSFGQTWTLDYQGNTVGEPLTTIGGEFRKMTLDPDGNVIGGGSALADAPTTSGTVDPQHNGGLDGWVGKTTETSNPNAPVLSVEKRLIYPQDGIIHPFQEVRYEVKVTMVEGEADVLLLDLLQGAELLALFPSPRLTPQDERRIREAQEEEPEGDGGPTPDPIYPTRGVFCDSIPDQAGAATVCRKFMLEGEMFRVLVHAMAPNNPGAVIRNSALADAGVSTAGPVELENVIVDPFGGINEVICQAVCDDGTALGLNPAKGVDEDGPICAAPFRKGSLAELVQPLKFVCTGPETLPDVLPLSLRYDSQVRITSKIIDLETGFSEALGLTGDFASGDHRVLAPGATPSGNENVFPGLVGNRPDGGGSVFWPEILAVRNTQGVYEINVANIRIDASGVTTERTSERFTINGDPSMGFAPAGSIGTFKLDLMSSPRLSKSYQGSPSLPGLDVRLNETIPGLFRKRFELRADLDFLKDDDLSESGFVPNGPLGNPDDPGGIGVATSGTRFAIQIEGLPVGLSSAYVPTCIDSASTSSDELLRRLVARLITDFESGYSGGVVMSDCIEEYEALARESTLRLAYEVTAPPGVTGADILDSFRVPIKFGCPPGTQGEGSIDTFLAPISLVERVEVLGDAPIPVFGQPRRPDQTFQWQDVCQGTAFQADQIKQPGITNAATFQNPPAPGGLASLGYQNGQIVELRTATSIPLPTRLKKTEFIIDLNQQPREKLQKVLIDGAEVQGFYRAPLLFTSPTQINAQIPWEIDPALGVVQGYILAGGILSEPFDIPVGAFSPGIFTFDFGPGRAIVTNLDNTVAQAEGSLIAFPALTARPARVGDFVVILATGLGPVTPPAVTGDNSLDENGNFIQRDLVEPVRVFIGGVEAIVTFAGLSPQFVGVYQLNVQIAEGTPVGDEVSIVIEIGGVRSREDVTIAVAP